jgi:hypothetical protein
MTLYKMRLEVFGIDIETVTECETEEEARESAALYVADLIREESQVWPVDEPDDGP